MNINLVAFDLFGVLLTEGHMVSGSLMSLLPEGAKQPTVKAAYNRYTRGEMTENDFWREIGQENNTKLRRIFLDSFELDSGVEHVTKALLVKYKLGILSNLAKEWAVTLSEQYQFANTFSPRIFSGEVKCEKPDEKIYQILMEESAYKAENILFIDDRLENLATAKRLGMFTVHYRREPDDFPYIADFQIDKLEQLLDILS